jgi:DNA-binding beta-propeller fold protein YncE
MNAKRNVWLIMVAGAASLLAGCGAEGQRDNAVALATTCRATPSSLTPADWRQPIPAPSSAAEHGALPGDSHGALHLVADVPLPGRAARFDYQSIDPLARRLYISHMNGDHLVVVGLDSSTVVAYLDELDRPTGVRAVPAEHMVYVSAAGRHEVAVVDDRTLKVVARVGGIRFPDGIAYAPAERKVFVSDENGDADVVIDARTNRKRSTIPLGGEAGNTHYDSVSHCVLVAVQTRNQLVAIDPATEHIVQRYDLPGSDHPHGFALDQPGRLAFVTSEESGILQVVDLRTMRILATHRVGDDPDVLAWDPGWRRLYVASESGVVSEYVAGGPVLRALGDLRLPHAHTVAVDPVSHRVYLPLQNLDGRPVLRILSPAP